MKFTPANFMICGVLYAFHRHSTNVYVDHLFYLQVAVRWHEVEGSKLIQSKIDILTTSLTMARDMLLVRLAYTFGWWKIEV